VPQTLTVLAPVRSGHEAALRDLLRPIGDDIRGKKADPNRPRIEFTRSQRIHFARFTILPDPDRGPERSRLLYASTYDGTLDEHLAELIAITPDMDAIWSHCDGYTGVGSFGGFVRAHAHEPHAFYLAFRDETVSGIRQAVTRSREEQGTQGGSQKTGGVGAAVQRFVRALPIVGDILRAIARCGFVNVFRSQLIVASLGRFWRFRVWNWLTGNRMPRRQTLYSSIAIDNCEFVAGSKDPAYREDVVAQNQLTLLTDIQPGRADRVRAVMAAIDAYAKRLSPPGSLIGVSTIHFVRWTVIDNGRRLLMISDYDGSWESYIDEFAEMILSGLDAIWSTAETYPPDGARDVPAFKRFLRSHQVPAEVFFSAYPDVTVLNIVKALP
jgi:hypothetical protein